MDRPAVLTLCDYYRPGFRAGGTVRTLEAIVALLGDEFEFRIVTRDRDLGLRRRYTDIRTDAWERVGAAHVMYLPPQSLTPFLIRRVIESSPHDILYLNSLFSIPFSLWPLLLRRLSMVNSEPVIVAPRGEVAEGALGLKRHRKRTYIELSRRLGLYRGVLWQASSQYELHEIRRTLGPSSQVFVAPDLSLTRPTSESGGRQSVNKTPGWLRAIFLSRISRKKNLDGALSILSRVHGRVELAIYGPIEDTRYWDECQSAISRLPPNVTVRYEGEIPPERVPDAISSHHLLFLPTLGENYGHVILEALSAGCPVLISDRTPWMNLEAIGVGWDVALEHTERFREILQECVEMDAADWRKMSGAATSYGQKMLRDPESQRLSRMLFRTSLQRQLLQGQPGARKGPPAGSQRDL